MADELPGAWGQSVEHGLEGGGVEVTCGGDADGAFGGEDAAFGDGRRGQKTAVTLLQGADEETAASAAADGSGPAGLKWIADRGDAGCLERVDDRARDAREQVGVLVGVGVGDADAGALELLDLRACFAGDLFLADAASEDGDGKLRERVMEAAAVRAEQSGDGGWVGDGKAVDEHDVAADAEGGAREGQRDRVGEGCAVGHQGGGGEDTGVVELGDGAVDAWREAKVVGVDDET